MQNKNFDPAEWEEEIPDYILQSYKFHSAKTRETFRNYANRMSNFYPHLQANAYKYESVDDYLKNSFDELGFNNPKPDNLLSEVKTAIRLFFDLNGVVYSNEEWYMFKAEPPLWVLKKMQDRVKEEEEEELREKIEVVKQKKKPGPKAKPKPEPVQEPVVSEVPEAPVLEEPVPEKAPVKRAMSSGRKREPAPKKKKEEDGDKKYTTRSVTKPTEADEVNESEDETLEEPPKVTQKRKPGPKPRASRSKKPKEISHTPKVVEKTIVPNSVTNGRAGEAPMMQNPAPRPYTDFVQQRMPVWQQPTQPTPVTPQQVQQSPFHQPEQRPDRQEQIDMIEQEDRFGLQTNIDVLKNYNAQVTQYISIIERKVNMLVRENAQLRKRLNPQ